MSITVTHYRKEQSLVSEPDERYVIEYRLRFRLAPNLKSVAGVDVKFSRVDVDRTRAQPDVLASLALLSAWNKSTPLLPVEELAAPGREFQGELVPIRADTWVDS